MSKDLEQELLSIAGGLGIPLRLEKDEDLRSLKKGREITAGELRSLPDNSVVWVQYREVGSRSCRINSAFRITKSSDPDTWDLSDGSSFREKLFLGGNADDAPATEFCDDGIMRVFLAHQPQPKSPEATLKQDLKQARLEIERLCKAGDRLCAVTTRVAWDHEVLLADRLDPALREWANVRGLIGDYRALSMLDQEGTTK